MTEIMALTIAIGDSDGGRVEIRDGENFGEFTNAWLDCHHNFILQCNMTTLRYPGSNERPR
jgi:hypothetical protein